MIPAPLAALAENRLAARFGVEIRIAEARPGSGGCINVTAHLKLSNGSRAFLKWLSSRPPPGFFQSEADGLQRLSAASPLRVPAVLALAEKDDPFQFLILEDLSHPSPSPHPAPPLSFDEELGYGLAAQHRVTAAAFGLDQDNFIGTTPQANGWMSSWGDFYRERRLVPLLRALDAQNALRAEDHRLFDGLMPRLGELLETGEPPSLLHGDLWSGNILPDAHGRPALIDPAVYYGHREADTAYTELFGGLSPRALQAYHEAWPPAEGHRDRASLLNLYHLLNHALLFGGGYLSQARSVAKRYAG